VLALEDEAVFRQLLHSRRRVAHRCQLIPFLGDFMGGDLDAAPP
jgi:hypothetical protein